MAPVYATGTYYACDRYGYTIRVWMGRACPTVSDGPQLLARARLYGRNRGAGDGEIVVSSAHPVPHDTTGVVRVNPLRVRLLDQCVDTCFVEVQRQLQFAQEFLAFAAAACHRRSQQASLPRASLSRTKKKTSRQLE